MKVYAGGRWQEVSTDQFIRDVAAVTGCTPRKNGRNVRVRCPAHDDHSPSLDIAEGRNGKPVTQCRSHGCDWGAIIEATYGRQPEWEDREPRPSRQPQSEPAASTDDDEFSAVYSYTDADGNEVYQVVRIDHPDGTKKFKQRYRHNRSWRWSKRRQQVPYRLHELAALKPGGTIWFHEGEKAADFFRDQTGLPSTCIAGGSYAKLPTNLASYFAGHHVVIVADDDDSGIAFAARVAHVLLDDDAVLSVRVVRSASGGECDDAVEHFEAGFGVDDFEPVELDTGLTFASLADVEMHSVEFLDEHGLIQADAFHVVAGIKGVSKSTWLAWVAARFTNGDFGPKRRVIWLALNEDSYELDVKPRIVAVGGDPEMVVVLSAGQFTLPDSVAALRRRARQYGDVGCIIIDPLGGAMPAGTNTNFDGDVRDAIAPLNPLAADLKCVMFGVRHVSHKAKSGTLSAAIIGSSDWVNVPRAVIGMMRDQDDKNVRHVQVVTNNRSPNRNGLRFRIEGVPMHEYGLTNEVARVVLEGKSEVNVDEEFATSKERAARGAADRALGEMLTILETEGEQLANDLYQRVAAIVGCSERTVKNARFAEGNKDWFVAREDTDGWHVSRSSKSRGVQADYDPTDGMTFEEAVAMTRDDGTFQA